VFAKQVKQRIRFNFVGNNYINYKHGNNYINYKHGNINRKDGQFASSFLKFII